MVISWEKLKRATEKFARVRLRKIHLDLLVGLLSVPVLITAIIINWGNLTKKQQTTSTSPTPQVIYVPSGSTSTTLPTASPSCIKQVGPIAISSPTEGQNVKDNPVCITIDYSDPTYCPVIWSYRINGGAWSDFSNNSPCLYNLPNGSVQFDLRVNSIVSSSSKTLSTTFTYSGSTIIPTPTPTPTPTPSPTSVPTSPTPSSVASSSAQ